MIAELNGVDDAEILVDTFPARDLKLSYIEEVADAPIYTMAYDGGGKEIDERIWKIMKSCEDECD